MLPKGQQVWFRKPGRVFAKTAGVVDDCFSNDSGRLVYAILAQDGIMWFIAEADVFIEKPIPKSATIEYKREAPKKSKAMARNRKYKKIIYACNELFAQKKSPSSSAVFAMTGTKISRHTIQRGIAFWKLTKGIE